MTVKEYIEELNNIVKKFPEVENFVAIFSSDEEGNDYKRVLYDPNLCQIHDVNSYSPEMVGFKGDDNIDDRDLNALCIN